jgi:hypothetical protein
VLLSVPDLFEEVHAAYPADGGVWRPLGYSRQHDGGVTRDAVSGWPVLCSYLRKPGAHARPAIPRASRSGEVKC